MSDDIIETIDNALDDWTVSPDAVRWTPEKVPEPSFGQPLRRGYAGVLVEDETHLWRTAALELHRETLRSAAAACSAAMATLTEQLLVAPEALARLGEALKAYQPAATYRVDRGEYHRRRKARARRRR